MHIRAIASPGTTRLPELIGVLALEGAKRPPVLDGLPAAPAVGAAWERGDVRGRWRETYRAYTGSHRTAPRILLVGAGKEDALDLDRVRRLAAIVVRQARRLGIRRAALDLRLLGEPRFLPGDLARAAAEGAVRASYRFSRYKSPEASDPDVALREMVFFASGSTAALRRGIDRGVRVAEAQNWSRELGDLPSNVLTPAALAGHARRMARAHGLRCRILGPQAIRRERMHALLAVAQGSAQSPRLILLEHRLRRGRAPIVLVGKGITFDSGGISLKPSRAMDEMKYDMCGAAAVLGALRAAAALRLDVPVVGIVAATENMPGGRAQRPGDVIRARNGVTIEVLNTDAEGRLVLADALSYAQRYRPQAIIDLATLTGAAVVALGHVATAVIGTSEDLIERIRDAGARSGDRVWPLPLWDEYLELVKSPVADVKNMGDPSGGAGTIVGAAFLRRFAGDAPWAHLDIAGTAWGVRARDDYERGATGVGVGLLARLLETWKGLPSARASTARGRKSRA